MTAKFNTASIQTPTPAYKNMNTRLSSFKDGLRVLTPLLIGSYCLLHGLWLVQADEMAANLCGLALWMWVPSCIHFAWRGVKMSALVRHQVDHFHLLAVTENRPLPGRSL